MSLIIVDCEAWGECPATGQLTEFGAVEFKSYKTFRGTIVKSRPSAENPAVPEKTGKPAFQVEMAVFDSFRLWLGEVSNGRPIFVSDNPAYDFMWIADGFWRTLGQNPFGYSGRRIGDFYAGLCADFYHRQDWKRLRVTPHTHDPVDDAMGNVEALHRIMRGER